MTTGPDQPPRHRSTEERLAWLEAKIEHGKWWRNPGWWGVVLSAFVGLTTLAWQTRPWELFQNDEPVKRVGTVKLIEGHASAFAKNEWDADLRVVNRTSRDIVVERILAIFGARKYGQSCRHGGKATRVLYPETQLRSGSERDLFQRVRPGEGAPFKGGPNIDRVFGAKRPCPLPVAKFHRRNKVTFIVFTNDGADWRTRGRLFYEPRARVSGGGGGLPCGLPPFLCC